MIPPGGEGEIKVTLTPKGLQEDIVKHINVLSDDPKQPRFALTMKGKLVVDVRATPSTVAMTNVPIGEPATARLELTIHDPEATQILSVKVEDEEHFSITALPEQQGPEKYAYEVLFRGSKTVQSFGTRVEVQTSSAEVGRVDVPVRALVVSNLRYAKRVQFVRKDGKLAPRSIRISAREGEAPKIGKIEDADGLLTFSVGKPEKGAVVIAASIDEDKFNALDEAAQRAMHTLVIHTNDRDEPKLEISYAVTAMATPARGNRVKPHTAAPAGH